jgi:hypothetical protein
VQRDGKLWKPAPGLFVAESYVFESSAADITLELFDDELLLGDDRLY